MCNIFSGYSLSYHNCVFGFTGTHNGNILVFSVSGLDISLTSTIQAHNHSVSCSAGVDESLVTGDDSGALQSWRLHSDGRVNKIAEQQSCK